MTLAQAILNILETAPRPVTAEVILAFLPGFYEGPELPNSHNSPPSPNSQKTKKPPTTKAPRETPLTTITTTLERLQALDEVLAIPHHHFGRLWKITPNGKAAIA